MRLAAISDLHIGARARTDTFGHAEADFLRFLDRLEAAHDVIVLLGDIYQTDHTVLPGRAQERRSLDVARERTRWFTDRAAQAPYVWVHGNHDAITAEALGAETTVVLGEPGCRVVLTHGDAYDPTIRAMPRLSRTGTWFAGRVRAMGLRSVAERLEDQDVQIKARRYGVPEGPYAQAADALMAEHDAQIVIMGHTHVPSLQRTARGQLANSGTCSLGRRMGVSVDTSSGAVRMLDG